eukprot:SM000266S09829  [mRNA]  locus=s266:33836:37055:+ [translate_table: standard]
MEFWDDWAAPPDMSALWRNPGVAAEWAARGSGSGKKVPMARLPGGRPVVTTTEMRAVADIIISRHFAGRVDPVSVCAIAEVESGRQPLAYRFEPHLGEASTGIMQVLQSTAEWLSRDMGYRAYTVDWANKMLYQPFVAVYVGAAYLNWLSTYAGKSVLTACPSRKHGSMGMFQLVTDRSEEFVVRGYNGGPRGIEKASTQRYWTKYLLAKEALLLKARAEVDKAVASAVAIAMAGASLPTSSLTARAGTAAVKAGGPLPAAPAPYLVPTGTWIYWEERASTRDLAELHKDPRVAEEWRKAGETGRGRIRFCRDQLSQPYLTKNELQAVVDIVLRTHFSQKRGLSAAMLCTLAEIRSKRYLCGSGTVHNGLMQVDLATARWLSRDLGYGAYPASSQEDLWRPFASCYYGAAYLHWLCNLDGRPRSEEFAVRSFLSGHALADSSQSLPFWKEYLKARVLYQ